MVHIFEDLTTVTGWGSHTFAWLDLRKFRIRLFAMGFDQPFLDKCEHTYLWNFARLLPALHDGSFYGDGYRGTNVGQNHLQGFAAFLCGMLTQQPEIPVERTFFQQNLLKDGFRFTDDGKLVEITQSVDVASPRELAELPNKKTLFQDLKRHLANKELVAVLFVDLDNFKRVNDELGHAEGDRCLIEIVRIVSSVIALKGKLYKVGGDEFCAVLMNFSAPEASSTAERIRATIDSLSAFGGKVKVTTSIGVVSSDARGLSSPEELVEVSDRAMYVAKYSGKNRISVWPLSDDEVRVADTNRAKSR
jgi:diguanylate cyclase (GGDEF)-like protein